MGGRSPSQTPHPRIQGQQRGGAPLWAQAFSRGGHLAWQRTVPARACESVCAQTCVHVPLYASCKTCEQSGPGEGREFHPEGSGDPLSEGQSPAAGWGRSLEPGTPGQSSSVYRCLQTWDPIPFILQHSRNSCVYSLKIHRLRCVPSQSRH